MNAQTSATTQTISEGEWLLDSRRMALVQMLGTAAFFPAGPLFFLWGKALDPQLSITQVLELMPQGLLLFLFLLMLHEVSHGIAFNWAGAKAHYGFKFVGGLPVFYTTAPGHWLTRQEYARVGIAPTFVVNILGLLLMAAVPTLRPGFVIALSLHITGCAGDWLMYNAVLRLPPEAEIYDTEHGFRWRLPQNRPVP
ncbi:MAG: DUF3267 domain-containing protein [Armatimonadota bacterium]|nr:DUF3267 domain-containing protein [Armatimonadota bacterium]